MLTIGVQYIYGIPDPLPSIPNGFRWLPLPGAFLQAERIADGRRFYATQDSQSIRLHSLSIATQDDCDRTNGRLKPGRYYIDHRETVEISPVDTQPKA